MDRNNLISDFWNKYGNAEAEIYASKLMDRLNIKTETMKYKIGIDPGIKTGMAIVEYGKYVSIETTTISKAFKHIDSLLIESNEIELYVENPNLRKWYGRNANIKQQGAGAIKIQYSQWVDFAKENKIKLHPIHPKDIGSQFDNEEVFKAATKWDKRTSIHARDAARILYKFTK